MVLELSDGKTIVPLSVFDVLDMVEDYLGVEVRQYLEDYFADEDPWADLSEDEKFIRLREHYEDLLDCIETVAMESDRLMHKNPIKRKQITENLQNIIGMIEREKNSMIEKERNDRL